MLQDQAQNALKRKRLFAYYLCQILKISVTYMNAIFHYTDQIQQHIYALK